MSRPTLWLSNWASARSPGQHGPGRKFTIMRRPRLWERGEGTVEAFVPNGHDLDAVRSEAISFFEYVCRCERVFETSRPHGPGHLFARSAGQLVEVLDGDSLCCSCAREAALAGRCHRVLAARFLVEAGWNVMLDGSTVGDSVAVGLVDLKAEPRDLQYLRLLGMVRGKVLDPTDGG